MVVQRHTRRKGMRKCSVWVRTSKERRERAQCTEHEHEDQLWVVVCVCAHGREAIHDDTKDAWHAAGCVLEAHVHVVNNHLRVVDDGVHQRGLDRGCVGLVPPIRALL